MTFLDNIEQIITLYPLLAFGATWQPVRLPC